jgi:hypothetical protein
MGSTARLALLALFLLSACQREPPPDRVRLELPEIVTNSAALRPLVRGHRDKTSTTLAPGTYTLTSEQPAIATANVDGTVACKKNGEASITAAVGQVQGRGVLRCRLVARLEVEEIPWFDLAGGPRTLTARAFGPDGQELNDVPILVSPTNRVPLQAKGLELTPLALGTTDLVVRAGAAERRFGTRVVKRLDPPISALRGGRRLEVALAPGKYEVEVTLKEDKELRMDWRGSRSCAYKATGRTHRSTCTLEAKGGVVLDNPTFLESGETAFAKDRIGVREVP